VPPKGSVVRSFFASDFICRATPSRAQDSGFPSRDFDLSSFAASVYRSPFSLGAPPGITGPRPRAVAISRPTSLVRAAPISSSRESAVPLTERAQFSPRFAGAGSLSDQSVTECWAASVNPVSSGVAFPSIHQLFICRFAVMRLRDFFVSLSPCA
jgi:hypothetical protein